VRDDVYAFGRVLEDVLHQLESRSIAAPDAEPFRALALRCLGPDAERPADAAELVRLV
jgi:serine/threonine-protein kinase